MTVIKKCIIRLLKVLPYYIRKYWLKIRRALSVDFMKCMYFITLDRIVQCIGIRHIQYLLLITLIIVGFGMRVSFNLAIIEMISDKKSDTYPTYPEWSDQKQILLSGFFWGYICCQIIAGQLGKRFGAKYPLFCAIMLTSLFTALMPVLGEHFGHHGVLACRIVQGLTQGFIFPSIHTVLSVWAPVTERTKYGAIVLAGGAVGNIIGMPLTGFLAASSVGWPAVFYCYGAAGVAWCLVWLIFGASGPTSSRWISDEEKKWVQHEVGEGESREEIPTPWKSIFTSRPFYALLFTHCGQNWGFWVLLTEIPSYLASILKFNITSNSLLSTLPYLVMFIVNVIMSQVADILVTKKIISLNTSRKMFNSIGLFVPAVALVALCLFGTSSKNLAIFFLVLGVSLNAGTNLGLMLNHIDLSPVHAGTLMGITNSIAAVFAILAPLAVGTIEYLTGYKEDDIALWNVVFYLTATVFFCAGNVFIFGGATTVQPWNSPEKAEPELSVAKVKTSDIDRKISVIY